MIPHPTRKPYVPMWLKDGALHVRMIPHHTQTQCGKTQLEPEIGNPHVIPNLFRNLFVAEGSGIGEGLFGSGMLICLDRV